MEDLNKALRKTLASTWRPAQDGTFPTIFLVGAEGGLPVVGQDSREKNEVTNSGNCKIHAHI